MAKEEVKTEVRIFTVDPVKSDIPLHCLVKRKRCIPIFRQRKINRMVRGMDGYEEYLEHYEDYHLWLYCPTQSLPVTRWQKMVHCIRAIGL